MWRVVLLVLTWAVSGFAQMEGPQLGSFKINIIDTGDPIPYAQTHYPSRGPEVGQIVNAHFYPALNFYQAGRYRDAYDQFSYVINRPSYLDGNPFQSHYQSVSHHSRGMIMLYHAAGPGRLTLAKADFEAALKWNPKNFASLLELSRVFSTVGLKEQAATVLRRLIDLNPDTEMQQTAEKELKALGAGSGQ